MRFVKYSFNYMKKVLFTAVNILLTGIQLAKTALSDIEVIHKEVQGAFYHMNYPLSRWFWYIIEVATTRPETMLGDTACCCSS